MHCMIAASREMSDEPNILGRRYARQKQVRWTVAPFAGVGMIHHATNGNNPFALSYGIQGQYKLSKRVSLLM